MSITGALNIKASVSCLSLLRNDFPIYGISIYPCQEKHGENAFFCALSIYEKVNYNLQNYSVLRATTGSFLAALLAGATPEIRVSPTLSRTSRTA